jgi:hypothetical protein
MWKIFVGFVIFAAAGLFLIYKAGDKIDMGGEKHDTGSTAAVEPAPAKPAAAASASK